MLMKQWQSCLLTWRRLGSGHFHDYGELTYISSMGGGDQAVTYDLPITKYEP